MNPRLQELTEAWRDEALTDEQAAELSALLRQSEEARRFFEEEGRWHSVLHAAVAASAVAAVSSRLPERNAVRFAPWLAAAAGVVLGAFCTSLAWAYNGARLGGTIMQLLAPALGGFEGTAGPIASGFPAKADLWSGDEAEIAAAPAREGQQALRFVRAAPDANTNDPRAGSCDVYQVIDLRPYRTSYAQGHAVLELSASFLDARGQQGGTALRFGCQLAVFQGSPEEIRHAWPGSKEEALARANEHVTVQGSAHPEWHALTTRMLLPANADFALLRLLVRREGPRTTTTPAEFGEQYVDAATLTLKTQPERP